MTDTKTLVTKSRRRRGKDDSDVTQETEPSPKRPILKKKPKRKT